VRNRVQVNVVGTDLERLSADRHYLVIVQIHGVHLRYHVGASNSRNVCSFVLAVDSCHILTVCVSEPLSVNRAQ
jgi:hypothetical protein